MTEKYGNPAANAAAFFCHDCGMNRSLLSAALLTLFLLAAPASAADITPWFTPGENYTGMIVGDLTLREAFAHWIDDMKAYQDLRLQTAKLQEFITTQCR